MTRRPHRSGLERARRWLDESADGLDSETLTALNQARLRASAPARSSHALLWWLGSTVSAAAAVLAVVLWWPASTRPPEVPAPDADALLVLSHGEDADVAQDMMFLMWLEENHAPS